MTFTKSHATEVQIDHVVPLGAAWARGARDWPQSERERFANDPVNLLATSASANESKSDRGPAEWLPRSAYRCAYAVQVDPSVHKLQARCHAAGRGEPDHPARRC